MNRNGLIILITTLWCNFSKKTFATAKRLVETRRPDGVDTFASRFGEVRSQEWVAGWAAIDIMKSDRWTRGWGDRCLPVH